MEPKIIARSAHIMSRRDISAEALKVLYRLHGAGNIAYLAGGCVRDLLLHRQPKDFDVVTDAHPGQVRSLFRNCRLIGRRFRLAHVFYPNGAIIEVATFRAAEGHAELQAARPPRHAHAVKTHDGLILRDNLFGTPEEDALRRDFTVNALFYNIADFSILDYVNGVHDLNLGVIRSIGEPRVRFTEDPVRMIRAIRFASALNFRIEERDYEALAAMAPHLARAAPARLYEEILKLFFCGHAERVFQHLQRTGLLGVLFPEFERWSVLPEGQAALSRTEAGLRALDEWRRQEREVSPALCFALIFGAYHKAAAVALARRGLPPWEALRAATTQHLTRLAPRLQIPKQVVMRAGDIMAAQPRLLERRRRDVEGLPRRPWFGEALAYLEFVARAHARYQDLAGWWSAVARR
jgi:poly(A) polymerase